MLIISFRSAYDMLLLLKKYPDLSALQQEDPVVKGFTALLSPFFPVLPQQRTFRQSLFLQKLRSPMMWKTWELYFSYKERLIKFVGFIWPVGQLANRLRLFFRSPEYRQRVFEILDRGRP
ncbi:MAG: hypothetical protein RIC19_09955 [Phaeodactylibacter sp.]|uniref:hypothetical protein n=1 Tax=Phaeodactylibacter sp. TaxID=1940289 RepID=UPI0032EFD341